MTEMTRKKPGTKPGTKLAPKTVDGQLAKAMDYLDRAVELADDEVQLFKIRRALAIFQKDISP
ncbi:MAG: hypothetical protein AAF066_03160 [Pseudomonadota bacterium]